MQKMMLTVALITQLLSIVSCNNFKESNQNKLEENTTSSSNTKDTLGNEPFCSLVINGKEYEVPSDSIVKSFGRLDSSFIITFKGISGGGVMLTIPNIFKCPCKIPTGYASIYNKIYGTEEYEVVPTVQLYNYGMPDISFRNLDDGFHKQKIAENAAEIIALQKISEDSAHKQVAYLMKGKIHTTVYKNVYHSNAGSINRDYKIEGSFVLKINISF